MSKYIYISSLEHYYGQTWSLENFKQRVPKSARLIFFQKIGIQGHTKYQFHNISNNNDILFSYTSKL